MAPLLQRPPPALRLAFLTLVGLLLLAGSCATHAFRILAVFPHPAKSHFAFFEPLVKELAARGHDVTALSHFPQRSRTPNYTDVSLQGTVPLMDTLTVAQVQHLTPISDFHVIHTIGLESCKPILTSPQVESFLAKEQRFDLFLSEAFTTDCFLGFAHRFKVPTVALSSAVLFSTVNDRFGNPANPAHVPNPFLGYGSRMTFTERLFNTLADLYMSWARSYYYDSPANWIAKRTFGRDMPSLDKLAKNTSLVLVNSHFSLHRPRPAVPAVVEVGGLHIKPASKLPKDIEKFISGAKDGVILFSMGSILQSKSLPEKRLKAFMQAFAELPQRVLWKYENDTLPDKPSNVMISPWIPQRDVLEHPNVKLFITHGGLLGLSEAVFCGVPILGIPMFGDQAYNVQAAVEAGVGELFPYYRTPYTNSILKAIRKVLDDDRYRNKARELSGVYRDRPSPPLDTAVYWVEYVARHGGASLRSPTIDLSTVEYLLLDVVAFLLALAAAVAFVAHRIYTNSDFSVLKAFFENKSKTK